jgi:4'-phosphopantetheinyl transferase
MSGIASVIWPQFLEGSDFPAIGADEIHVWRADLDLAAEKLRALEGLLPPDEIERADRFRFPEHRARFVAARGTLRRILGLHLRLAPESLRFSYGEHGKPALAAPLGTDLEFNVSHSSDLALYAVAMGRAVGVDVERVKSEGSWLQIAERYFAPHEAAYLASLPVAAAREKFFELWSGKEARMKARGTGLLSLESDEDLAKWSVVKVYPQPEYAAAVAFATGPVAPEIVMHRFEA